MQRYKNSSSLVVALLASVALTLVIVPEVFPLQNATKHRIKPEAWTLDGDPLYPMTFSGLVRQRLDAQLTIARDNLMSPPAEDPAKHVWLDRRLAYKWLYRQTRTVHSHAVAKWPKNAPLLRHSGHNYITARNFTKAKRDLQKAASLITHKKKADGWEPDGKPNRYNLPLYSRHFNIYYHLGLSRYLQGNFEGAVEAYNQLMELIVPPRNKPFSNEDALVAAVHWRYMALQRVGHLATSSQVQETLQWIQPRMKALDVGTYLQMCFVYKGYQPLPDLTNITNPLDFATRGYGIGNYHFYNGQKDQAVAVWKQVVQNATYWPAFGFTAAEADLHGLKNGSGLKSVV